MKCSADNMAGLFHATLVFALCASSDREEYMSKSAMLL